jgi:RNA polymerase sigma factor (sigma-70 family)
LARDDTTIGIERAIGRLLAGDESARAELLSCASERLKRLARKMLKGYTSVARWEDGDDVAQNALIRLDRALHKVTPPTARDFFRLAAALVRRELIDLTRHYYGPRGPGAHHSSEAERRGSDEGVATVPSAPDTTSDPGKLAAWSEFHRAVDSLGEPDRELFDLLWYQGLTRIEAARVLDVSERTISSRWLLAKVHLSDFLGGHLPF